MCGILATIGDELPDIGTFTGALELIRHRGPDDGGSWEDRGVILGNRRLAIIDTSSAGHQPMVDDEAGVAVTFNGEIYNYVELRQELEGLGHRFRTRTDTEVLLRAYLAWGERCVDRFNGMWAFVIWDRRQRRAFFSRDRFGVKPCYYALVGGTLAIASEPKVLLGLYPHLRRPEDATLYRFLADGRLHDTASGFYAGIRSLPPGNSGTFAPGWTEPRVTRYWIYPATDRSETSFDQALDRFAAILDDAVRLRMRSDVPVGVTLSGGLDSTAVLHGAEQTRRAAGSGALNAFTSVYASPPGEAATDERHWASAAAAPYPAVDLLQVPADSGDWLAVLRRIVWHMDGPSSSPAVFPLWNIMATARARGVPVLLEGQGADELLGGYPHHGAHSFLAELRRSATRPSPGQFRELCGSMRAGQRAFSGRLFALWLARETFPALKGRYRRRVGALGTLRPDFVRACRDVRYVPVAGPAAGDGGRLDPLNQRLLDDFAATVLPRLLQYGDAISMAHSIETRLPFLDYRLVELCFGLPSSLKVAGGESKRLLRAYLRRAGQGAIAARGDKRGYPTPADQWLAADNGRLLRELLLDPDAAIRSYVVPARLDRLIDYHAKGRYGAGNHLYRLLTTELWLRECLRPLALPVPAEPVAHRSPDLALVS